MQNNWSTNGFSLINRPADGGKTVVWTPIHNGPKRQSYADTRMRDYISWNYKWRSACVTFNPFHFGHNWSRMCQGKWNRGITAVSEGDQNVTSVVPQASPFIENVLFSSGDDFFKNSSSTDIRVFFVVLFRKLLEFRKVQLANFVNCKQYLCTDDVMMLIGFGRACIW